MKNKLRYVLLLVYNYILLFSEKIIKCSDIFSSEIPEFNTGGDVQSGAKDFAGSILGVLAGIISVVGIILVALGIFNYLKARYEESPTGESKAIQFISIGAVLMLIRAIFKVIAG